MNQAEIRAGIDKNNKMIEDLMSPNTFVLNNLVYDLLKENKQMQEQCQHKYEEGFCIFCDYMDPDHEEE